MNRLKNNFILIIFVFISISNIGVLSAYAAYSPINDIALPSIVAKKGVVIDFDTDEIYYDKNMDSPQPAASMTKLMTLYLTFDSIKNGKLTLDTPVTISEYVAKMSNNRAYSGLERFKTGEQVSVNTLITLTEVYSCCAASTALAEIVSGNEANFVELMNKTAESWGIQAHFADASGFEDEGNSVTPRAMAYIAKKIITEYPEIFDYSTVKNYTFKSKNYTNTNTLLDSMDGVDGLKTGMTFGAGYCFVGTAKRGDARIISVVMNSNNYNNRMNDSRKLLEFGFKCREIRENQWSSEIHSDDVDFEIKLNNPSKELFRYSTLEIESNITKVPEHGHSEANITWYVNNNKIENNLYSISKNAKQIFKYTVEDDIDTVEIKAELELNSGDKIYKSIKLPIYEAKMIYNSDISGVNFGIYPNLKLMILNPEFIDSDNFDKTSGLYINGEIAKNHVTGFINFNSLVNRNKPMINGSINLLNIGNNVIEFRYNTMVNENIRQKIIRANLVIYESGVSN